MVRFCWSCKIIGRFFQKQTLEVEYCTLFYFQRVQSFLLARSVSPMQSLEKLRKRKKILRRKILKRRTEKRRQLPEFLRVSMIQQKISSPQPTASPIAKVQEEKEPEKEEEDSACGCHALRLQTLCLHQLIISSLLCAGPSVAIAL